MRWRRRARSRSATSKTTRLTTVQAGLMPSSRAWMRRRRRRVSETALRMVSGTNSCARIVADGARMPGPADGDRADGTSPPVQSVDPPAAADGSLGSASGVTDVTALD